MARDIDPIDLDNYITGHWGEDQFRDDEPVCCQHCGKDLEDMSELGCKHCDKRHPESGIL